MAKIDESFEALGLTRDATLSELKEAYHWRAKTMHPDVGGCPAEFSNLVKHYSRAMEHAKTPRQCPDCKGKGKISKSSGFNTVSKKCKTCKGKGVLSNV